MKFKVGDKVRVKANKNTGKIVSINENENTVIVSFDGGMSGHSCIYDEKYLESIEEQSQNLIPQIAKMLGVEIGEEFMLTGVLSEGRSSNTKFRFTDNGVEINDNYWMERPSFLTPILNGNYKIKKLPKTPILTEDEKAILRNLPKLYKWIVRDNSGELYVYETKPKKGDNRWIIFGSDYFNNLNMFHHLFQFIKWEDEESYNIQELLEEYENLRSE